MSEWTLQLIAILPDGLSYLLLIVLVSFLEALPLLGLAMPGSTLIVLSGFLAAHDKGTMSHLILACITGAFIGDFVSYWLGGRLGQRLMAAPWLRKHQKRFQEAEIFFSNHGGKSLFYARFLGPIRGTIPFLAGVTRMPPGFFCRMTLVSAVLWGIAYPGLGYLGGESWQRASDLSSRLGLLILLAFLASLFHLWLKQKTEKKSRP